MYRIAGNCSGVTIRYFRGQADLHEIVPHGKRRHGLSERMQCSAGSEVK